VSPNNPEIWGAASRGPDFIIAASANNLAKAVYAIGFGGLAAAGRPDRIDRPRAARLRRSGGLPRLSKGRFRIDAAAAQ
jgi:hypothetical protein